MRRWGYRCTCMDHRCSGCIHLDRTGIRLVAANSELVRKPLGYPVAVAVALVDMDCTDHMAVALVDMDCTGHMAVVVHMDYRMVVHMDSRYRMVDRNRCCNKDCYMCCRSFRGTNSLHGCMYSNDIRLGHNSYRSCNRTTVRHRNHTKVGIPVPMIRFR